MKRLLRNLGIILLGIFIKIAYADPAVYWASSLADPGDVAAIAGRGLDRSKNFQIASLSDGDRTSIRWVPPLQVQKKKNVIKFVVPPGFDRSVLAYRFSVDGKEFSGQINNPRVYWAQAQGGNRAAAGDWIRVFGTNLDLLDAKTITLKGEKSYEIPFADIGRWEVKVQVPDYVAAGRYEIKLQLSEKKGVSLGPVDIFKKSENTAVHLAAQTDSLENGRRLMAALEALSRGGGGSLVLSSGDYQLIGQLVIPINVSVVGENKDNVRIFWADTDSPPNALIQGDGKFSLENITFSAGRYFNFIKGGFGIEGADALGGVTLRNLVIRANSFAGHLSPEQSMQRSKERQSRGWENNNVISLSGKNLVVESVDALGSGRVLFLFNAYDARVANSKLYNGRYGWYSLSGTRNLIFENNEIVGADLQATGGGPNTLMKSHPYSENIIFKGNKFSRFFGWDREALTSDGGGGFYTGGVACSTTDSDGAKKMILTGGKFSDDPRSWTGAGVFFIDGKGFGQYARISERVANTIVLEDKIATCPDGSSVVSIVPMQRNYLIVDNEFVDTGVAAQLYGTSVNSVVSGNISLRTSGFKSWPLVYGGYPQPGWYNYIVSNKIGGNNGEEFGIFLLAGQSAKVQAPLNYLNTVRLNYLSPGGKIIMRSNNPSKVGVLDAIIQKNQFEDKSTNSLDVGVGVKDYLSIN